MKRTRGAMSHRRTGGGLWGGRGNNFILKTQEMGFAGLYISKFLRVRMPQTPPPLQHSSWPRVGQANVCPPKFRGPYAYIWHEYIQDGGSTSQNNGRGIINREKQCFFCNLRRSTASDLVQPPILGNN